MAMMSSRPCSLVWSVRGSSSLAKWCKRETGVWAEAVMRSSVKKRCRVFRRESFAVHLSKGKGLGNNSCGFMARRCDCPAIPPKLVYLSSTEEEALGAWLANATSLKRYRLEDLVDLTIKALVNPQRSAEFKGKVLTNFKDSV